MRCFARLLYHSFSAYISAGASPTLSKSAVGPISRSYHEVLSQKSKVRVQESLVTHYMLVLSRCSSLALLRMVGGRHDYHYRKARIDCLWLSLANARV
jgi:hypothetical protein